MADKKYYWLKLTSDFFKDDIQKVIEDAPNGEKCLLFYVKCLTESIGHNGELWLKDGVPHSEATIASVTRTKPPIVKAALKLFKELGLVETMSDGVMRMTEIDNMVGSETEWAKKKRAYRENKDNVPYMSSECPQEVSVESTSKRGQCPIRDIEIRDIDKKEKDKREKRDYQQVVDLYNELCPSFPKVTTLSEARKKAIGARLAKYTIDDFRKMFLMAESSDFLKGSNNKNWSANFDWMIKDANMAKILDGNYRNQQPMVFTGKKGAFHHFEQRDVDYESLEAQLGL